MISKKKDRVKTKLNGKKTQKEFKKRRKTQRILHGGAANAIINTSISSTDNRDRDRDIGIENGESLLEYLSKDEYRTYFDDTNPKPIYSDHAPVVYTIPYINNPEKQKTIITWNVAKYGNSIIKSINKKTKQKNNKVTTLVTCPDGVKLINDNVIIEFAHKFNGGIKGPFTYCELKTLRDDGEIVNKQPIYNGYLQDGIEMYSKYLIRLANIADAINTMYKKYDNPIIMLQELPNNQDMDFFIDKLKEFKLRIEHLPEKEGKKEIIITEISNTNSRLQKIPEDKRASVKQRLQNALTKKLSEKIQADTEKSKKRNPEFPYQNDEDNIKLYNEFGIVVKKDDDINFNYDINELNDKLYKCMEDKKEDKTKKDIVKRYSIYLNKENKKNIYYVCLHCFSDTEESLIQMLNNIIECTIQVAEEKTANHSLNNLYPNQFIFAGDFNRIMHKSKVLTLLKGTNQTLYTNKEGKGNNLSDNKGTINPKGNIDLLITTDIPPKETVEPTIH